MDNVIIVRYAEIFLKGLNRPFFERALVRNIAAALKNIQGARVRRGQSRIYVEGVNDAQLQAALDALSCVFGIHSYSVGVRLEPDFDRAAEVLVQQVSKVRAKFPGEIVTFRVEAKRAKHQPQA
jgi:thiamine biosynthesis protein ThiI